MWPGPVGNKGSGLPGAEEKLVVVITAEADADRLIHRLVQQGYPATKIASTGGFLRRGNATVLSGVEASEIESVLALVRAECRAHTEYIPVQALPFPESISAREPAEVRVGGAIVFVLPVERFEKT
ncbi:MAG: cyclic-di-AMP receptor [Dehalococcoidia bacterium]